MNFLKKLKAMIVNYRTEESIARDVYKSLSFREMDIIGAVTHPVDMSQFHHTLGADIRNRYHLWWRDHTPVIYQGVDMSPYHPDQISNRILKRVWEMVHEW